MHFIRTATISPNIIRVTFVCLFLEQHFQFGQDLLIYDVSGSHSVTPHSVGLLWTSDQLVPVRVTYLALKSERIFSAVRNENSNNILKIKPTRCTNFSNLFLEWNSTCFGQFLCPSSGVFHCTHSNGICHRGLLTACEQDQDGMEFHPDPAHKLSTNLCGIYQCCVYSEKLLMMDRGTVLSM